MRTRFTAYLFLIAVLGLALRVNGYDRTPAWNESLDELNYAWTGLTWIKEGVPKSWSYLDSYKKAEIRRMWGTDFRLVSPMLEKPPLYSLLSGGVALLFNQNALEEVRVSTIRLLPLMLSVFTIFLTGIVGRRVFSPATGILAAFLYATTPPLVLANRLSVTENLLTPLFLGLQVIFLRIKPASSGTKQAISVGILAGLAALTKQIGLTAILVNGFLWGHLKHWKLLMISVIISLLLFSIYPLTGAVYDWHLFRSIQAELRRIGLQGGLPQLIQTIVGRPLITTEKLFPDGTLLLGYLLLFTSPWWLFASFSSESEKFALRVVPSSAPLRLNNKVYHDSHGNSIQNWPHTIFLAFPFAYLIYLVIIITGAESIGSGQAYWGWYAYPLFPYATILVAFILHSLWQKFSQLQALLLFLILGSSSIRYFFLFQPRVAHYRWQHALVVLLTLVVSMKLIPLEKNKKLVLFGLFVLFLGVNIYTSININHLYPSLSQPP